MNVSEYPRKKTDENGAMISISIAPNLRRETESEKERERESERGRESELQSETERE